MMIKKHNDMALRFKINSIMFLTVYFLFLFYPLFIIYAIYYLKVINMCFIKLHNEYINANTKMRHDKNNSNKLY